MLRRKWFPLLTLPVVISGLILSSLPASASSTVLHAAKSAPAPIIGSGYVIVNPASAVAANGATFYPTGPLSENTLVVIANPDGSLPGGITTAGLKSLVAKIQAVPSGSTSTIAVGPTSAPSAATSAAEPSSVKPAAATRYAWAASSGGYGSYFTGGGILGATWRAKALYNWDTSAGFNQGAATEGIEHYRGYNGSTFGVWTTAYNTGSGGSGGKFVPWGMVLDNERFRGWCTVSTVCGGSFWDQ